MLSNGKGDQIFVKETPHHGWKTSCRLLELFLKMMNIGNIAQNLKTKYLSEIKKIDIMLYPDVFLYSSNVSIPFQRPCSQHWWTWSQERGRNISETIVFIFHLSSQHDETSGDTFYNWILKSYFQGNAFSSTSAARPIEMVRPKHSRVRYWYWCIEWGTEYPQSVQQKHHNDIGGTCTILNVERTAPQSVFSCSKSTMKTTEQHVKSVQS